MSEPGVNPLSPEQVAQLLEQIQAEGIRLAFLDEAGGVITNHAKIRLLVSNLVATTFLSCVGFALNSPKGVFAVPGRVGSVVTKVRPAYDMRLPGGALRQIPENIRLSFTPSRQLQTQLMQFHREQRKSQDTTQPQRTVNASATPTQHNGEPSEYQRNPIDFPGAGS